MHIDILVALGMRPEENVTKNGEPTFGFLLHDNAAAHRPVLVKDFLIKNNVRTLDRPPYLLHIHI